MSDHNEPWEPDVPGPEPDKVTQPEKDEAKLPPRGYQPPPLKAADAQKKHPGIGPHQRNPAYRSSPSGSH